MMDSTCSLSLTGRIHHDRNNLHPRNGHDGFYLFFEFDRHEIIGFAGFDTDTTTWNLEKEGTFIRCSYQKTRQLNMAEVRIEYENKKALNSNGI